MAQTQSGATAYVCPMHPDIRLPGPGKCSKCGMALLPEAPNSACSGI